jgi:DNA helicase-2/ATP-dependent DNA helicase PcrA
MQKKLDWSSYQVDIFRAIAKTNDNLIVIARAGSAKTTVLVEGAKYIPKGKRLLFCAFNKSIQEELSSKLGSFVDCMTLHSLGYRAVRQRFPNVVLNNNKCWEIVENLVDDPKERYDLIDNVCKTVSLCKSTIIDTSSKIDDLIDQYGIDTCDVEREVFIQYVCKALRQCKEKTDTLDYDDMVWWPFVFNLNAGSFDVVMIDECHDLSKIMIALALSVVKPGGRVIAVIDPWQAIYNWRGADASALDNLRHRLKPKEFPLPICYRCPKKIVALAQKIVSDIQPFEHNGDGEIINIALVDIQKHIKPNSYLLSRTNAPLIALCMRLIKNGIPTNILGRDIGDGLLYLIKRSKKKKVDAFLKWLDNWEKTERKRMLDKNPRANTEWISDKAECLQNLCSGTSSIEEVKDNIKNLFKDGDERSIVLGSSIHRIKGKESDTVFILADTLRSNSEEERRCNYVAFTRTRGKLYMVRKINIEEDE